MRYTAGVQRGSFGIIFPELKRRYNRGHKWLTMILCSFEFGLVTGPKLTETREHSLSLSTGTD